MARDAAACLLLLLGIGGFADTAAWGDYFPQLNGYDDERSQGIEWSNQQDNLNEFETHNVESLQNNERQWPDLSAAEQKQDEQTQKEWENQGQEQGQVQGQEQAEQANDVEERCLLPSDGGPCRALMHKYYYNSKTKKCEKFAYGGCRGNANRFQTVKECEEACSSKVIEEETK